MELSPRGKTIISISVLLALSAALIFFKSGEVPRNLAYDEVASTHLALSLKSQAPILYSPLATGHTTPYFYIILLFFELLGVHNWVLRLPAALFGVAAMGVAYLLFRKLFRGYVTAFILSTVFVSMHWYLTFARFSFEATFLLFLELTSLLFLVMAHEEQRPWQTVIGAFFASLAFYSYTPGRLFPIIAGLFGFYHTKRRAFMLQVVIMMVLITPLVIFLSTNTDTRIEQVSVIANRSLTTRQKAIAIGENTLKAASMFVAHGDMNGRHNYPGKPAINPLLALFVTVGLVLAFVRLREGYNGFFLGYFILAFIPMILTNPSDNPNMLRSVSVLPSLMYFAGLTVQWVPTRVPKRYNRLVLATIALALALSAAYELRTYFLFQSRVMRNSFEVKCNLEQLAATGYAYVPKWCGVKKNEF